MAIGVYVALSGMSTDKYRECTERLKQAGAAHPLGRSYHAAFGPHAAELTGDVRNFTDRIPVTQISEIVVESSLKV